jgi:NAD(P)-dependent dehydrogenase (short-subunit alcohol dehydrogenase family)
MVTGAGSGIGRAIAVRLAGDGHAVAVVDLDGSVAGAVAEEIAAAGGAALAVGEIDVSDRSLVDEAVAQIHDGLGDIAVLVNNAGMTGFRRFLDLTEEKWDRNLRVNLYGPFHCTQAVLPDMLAAGWGRIVNISSSAGQTGQPYMVHYASAKAGLIGFTKALALEVASEGVTVNTIPPASVDTPMLRESERRGVLGGPAEEIAARIPVGRLGEPDDIASACAFLVSDDASYVTGQVIGVNGGYITG